LPTSPGPSNIDDGELALACVEEDIGAMEPNEPLTSLAPGLWVATRPLLLAVGDIGTRMTVVRLPSGGLFLHSPVRLDEPTRRALDAIGPVRCVVAPSKVHHFYVGDYRAAYPEARLYAAPGLPEKRKDLRFDAVIGEAPPPEWEGVLDHTLFRGAPLMNEVVFLHRPSRTLILTDLAFNMVQAPRGRARLFCWVVGAGRRLGPHRIIRFGIRDRAAAHESVQRILQWDFDRVVVTHGEVLASGGKRAFAEGFAYLGG
jgi:hypothetical protein